MVAPLSDRPRRLAFAVVVGLIAKIAPLRDSIGATPYIARLGIFSDAWALCAIALAALIMYVVLRILHNVELYEYIATYVKHVPVRDVTAAIIFEVVIPAKGPAERAR